MMKVLVITDISILSFYEYIRYISRYILTQNVDGPKID